MSLAPDLTVERAILAAGARVLACADEVGRGALAGPVSIGMVVLDATTDDAPVDVRDSKLLTPRRREALVPAVQAWAGAWAVGHASADEIDEHGIVGAMHLAGQRALARLTTPVSVVLLDGNLDYLSVLGGPEVVTRVKGDLTCAGVAAASILAKVERDRIMRDLSVEHPDYDWAGNKGYASATHVEALTRLGPTPYHRRSWKLPGVGS